MTALISEAVASSRDESFQAFLASRTGLFAEVVKRDGRRVPFAAERIHGALRKAGEATGEYDTEMALRLTTRVINVAMSVLQTERPSVEDIQDVCEEVLLDSPFRRTARAFIVYRTQHAQMREFQKEADLARVDQYLERLDWQVKENSNMSFSLQGLNQYLSSGLSKGYWLNRIYAPEIKAAHEAGDFHLHDLGLISVYCVGWDLYDLLATGFRGVPGKIEAKPAKHFRAALGQVVNFFYTLQGEAAGAQAFSSFDTLLAPLIRYDGLTDAQLRQALQEFLFNVNVPTRVGFQTPFTNITLDLSCPRHYAQQPVMRGGELQQETYGEFQEEMDRLNRAFFEVMTAGDAKGRIFTFPIPTINLTKDFDWDNANLEGLWAMTGKYGIPYFSNFINSELDPEDARSMCCRLRIDNTKLEKRGGGLFGAHPLTGSVGVVTLNLPRAAYESASEEAFQERVGRLMDLARDSLQTKRKFLEHLTAGGLYPYTAFYLRHMKDRFGEYWKNHFSTIGLVGMHEACMNLLGTGIDSLEGKALAERTLSFMRERLMVYQEETGAHFNLEATPAESTAYRFARLDRERYPEIRQAPTAGAEPYYTNSSHLPVSEVADPFAVLDHQDDLQTLYTGGTVLHLFLGERITDPQAVRSFVRKIAERYRLPYFSLTPTFSVCPNHGYLSGEQPTCPHCGARTEVYSRIVGYLRPLAQWNVGKQAEFADRRPVLLVEAEKAATVAV